MIITILMIITIMIIYIRCKIHPYRESIFKSFQREASIPQQLKKVNPWTTSMNSMTSSDTFCQVVKTGLVKFHSESFIVKVS